jgi:hypothetical protein
VRSEIVIRAGLIRLSLGLARKQNIEPVDCFVEAASTVRRKLSTLSLSAGHLGPRAQVSRVTALPLAESSPLFAGGEVATVTDSKALGACKAVVRLLF